MTTDTAEITLAVGQPGGDDDAMTQIGEVSFGAGGKLRLLEANATFQSTLEEILAVVNAQEELRIKVPPPPDAEARGVFRRAVSRDEPDLLEALGIYMEQKYNLFLTRKAAA